MFNQLQDYYQRYKQSKQYKHDLDALLDRANPEDPLEDRLHWAVELMQWVRYQVVLKDYSEVANTRLPSTRIRFLLQLLDRNPVWKQRTAVTMRSILRDLDCLDLFVESGLPQATGFFSELRHRVMTKIMPERPLSDGLGSLFQAMFPSQDDADWIRSLEPEIVDRIITFIHFEETDDEACWKLVEKDIGDAIFLLVADVRAIGLSTPMRSRMDFSRLQDLPFFDLTKVTESLLYAYHHSPAAEYSQVRLNYLEKINACFESFQSVYSHLDTHGVSTTVVYSLASAQAKLRRIRDLVSLLTHEKIPARHVKNFIAQLIEENLHKESFFALINDNFQLMSRKIVDRSAETGETYIARTRKDYLRTFRKAAGGGAVSSVTVIIKLMIVLISLPLFLGGILASINYAIGFLAIQFFGFMLATKQPGMTGPALANRLQQVNEGAPMDLLVDEITKIFRTQFVGVAGNVMLVIPCVMLIDMVFSLLVGNTIVQSPETAKYIFSATDILGLTLPFACITGVLLWLSSIFAGYVDNWFFLHRMKRVIELNRTLIFVFGKERCQQLAKFLEKHISEIAANISLGFLLGMTPEILAFFGLFIQVPHVTLSSGTLALGIRHFGLDTFYMPEFYRAVAGIFGIGIINVSVSFYLAFFIALRARNMRASKKREIYFALLSRLRKSPFSFFFPTKI